MAQTIPPDSRAPGQSGHITDHNNVSDMLSLHSAQIGALSGIVSGQYLGAPVSWAPATPATAPVSSATLAAWSSANINTGQFTAPPSGRVVITASFVMQVSAASTTIMAALGAHGSVTPATTTVTWQEATASSPRLINLRFYVVGLTSGVSYNYDLLGAAGGSATATILAQGLTSATVGAAGGPVVMTVQAA